MKRGYFPKAPKIKTTVSHSSKGTSVSRSKRLGGVTTTTSSRSTGTTRTTSIRVGNATQTTKIGPNGKVSNSTTTRIKFGGTTVKSRWKWF